MVAVRNVSGPSADGAWGPEVGTTGSYLVLLEEEDLDASIKALQSTASVSVMSASEVEAGALGGSSETR